MEELKDVLALQLTHRELTLLEGSRLLFQSGNCFVTLELDQQQQQEQQQHLYQLPDHKFITSYGFDQDYEPKRIVVGTRGEENSVMVFSLPNFRLIANCSMNSGLINDIRRE